MAVEHWNSEQSFIGKGIASQFNSRTALLQHPDIQRFIEWLSKRPAGFKPHVKRGR
jgi:hypothetical protein